MSDYRIEAASKVEWAERALRAEAESARLRASLETVNSFWHEEMTTTVAAALESILAENERLREALIEIRDNPCMEPEGNSEIARTALETKGTRDE